MIEVYPTITMDGYVIEKTKDIDFEKAKSFLEKYMEEQFVSDKKVSIYTVFDVEESELLNDEEVEDHIISIKGWLFCYK